MARAKILYFSGEIPQGDPEGDQRILFRKLHLLSKERDHVVLASFLQSVTNALKQECRQLEIHRRELVPSFESVLDLTDHVLKLRKTPLGGAIERVLVLVFQLGVFITYHEANPLEYDFQRASTAIIGRGPGLLSGAAIALSPSILAIPAIAEELTRIAFRFGLVVDHVCRSLEVSPDEINADGAWVYCAHGVGYEEASQAVAAFNAEMAYPETNMITVFNADDTSVSIGGPPSSLRALFSSCKLFEKTTNVPMRKVQGMWHTSKSYGSEHVQEILSGIEPNSVPHLPLYLPMNGKPSEATDAKTLLKDIMTEILTQRIRWKLTIEGVSEQLRRAEPNETQFLSVQASHYMENALKNWRTDLPSTVASSLDMMSTVMNIPISQSPARDSRASKIAVVGMACRFPGGADDTEKFWELLRQGYDAHSAVPPDRFDVSTHVDPTGEKKNTSRTPYGCFVDNPGLFDAFFFGMSPREAEQTDPMQRLALITAYEALESSGYTHQRGVHRHRVGTFYGQASDDYREANTGQDIGTYFISGGCRAFGPGRINYFMNFWGPSFSIDTACSSSLAAIQAACSSLWAGDVDMAITGGMNILTNSDVYSGLSKGHFLSPSGGCKTWDEGADGYCRADGVGSVILKRLEDAEADNDNVLAVVLSAATDHSAEAVSITHPHDGAQALLYDQIVKRAGIDPMSVGYVEMHGTGTQAGDPTEMRSVTSIFANGQPRKCSLHIGSVKANVGHGEAAAGVMAFIKAMLIFQKGVIPPHIGIKTQINPALPINLSERGVVIPTTVTPWGPSEKSKRLAMVNNFGAAGGNTAMILEEAASRPKMGTDPRPTYPITVSARTPKSFQENIRRLVAYLEAKSDISLADLSYTVTARKFHYNYRISVAASSVAETASALRSHIGSSIDQAPAPSGSHSIAFAFTGQGTFYLGIGAQLYRDSAPFRRHLDRLDGIAQRQNFPSFLPVVTSSCRLEDVSTASMHLSIVCVELALTRLWASYGVTPSIVIGHSLGEYAALHAAGVLSESAVVYLVGTRATLLDSKCTLLTHGMLSVRASTSKIAQAAGAIQYDVACINGTEETVVGGTMENLHELSIALSAANCQSMMLNVPHAYHSAQMDILLDDFVRKSRSIIFNPPRVPVISPLHANVLTSGIDASYLAEATRKTVDYIGSLDAAWKTGDIGGSTIWIEIGHHPCCCKFVKKTFPETRLTCPTLKNNIDNWATLGQTLCTLYDAGVEIDWTEFHRPFEQALRLVDVPTYAWDLRNYWIQYDGDWNLTKGQKSSGVSVASSHLTSFRTSSIHIIRSEIYSECSAQILAETDIADPALQMVVDGHAMNGYGVASSFLHAEIAFTLAKRIRDQCLSSSARTGINVHSFEYHEPVVKHRKPTEPQPVIVSAEANLATGEVNMKWYNPAKDMWYCHASASYEDPSSWLTTWSRSAGLVTSRISALYDMATRGEADRLTTRLAYSLFAKLVDYSDMYQTMKSVIIRCDEAVAEVEYPSDAAGSWTMPPHFIDGCVSLSGFILNGGSAFDNTNNFFITPSWKSMRFAKPLAPGGRYLAYVRMIPAEANAFVGDVYILQDSEIVGVVEAIEFRQWPRVMLNRFFQPPVINVEKKRGGNSHHPLPQTLTPPLVAQPSLLPALAASHPPGSPLPVSRTAADLPTPATTPPNEKPLGDNKTDQQSDDPVTARALDIVAEELGVDSRMLTDDAKISDLGLDSLMSLVLSQKLREQLDVEIRDAFFLEVTTIGDLKQLVC